MQPFFKLLQCIDEDYGRVALIAMICYYVVLMIASAMGSLRFLEVQPDRKRRIPATILPLVTFLTSTCLASYFALSNLLLSNVVQLVGCFLAARFFAGKDTPDALLHTVLCKLLLSCCSESTLMLIGLFDWITADFTRNIVVRTLLFVAMIVLTLTGLRLQRLYAPGVSRLMPWILLCFTAAFMMRNYLEDPLVQPFLPIFILSLISSCAAVLLLRGFMIRRRVHAQIVQQEQALRQLTEQYESLAVLRHDLRNMTGCVQALLREGKVEEASRYLDSIRQSEPLGSERFYSSCAPVNAVINTKLGGAADIPSSCRITAVIPDEMAYDVSLILANLLDNAIRASRKQDTGCELRVSITASCGYLQVIVQNRIENSVLAKDPALSTDKEDKAQHGWGLRSVRMLAERHDGTLDLYEKTACSRRAFCSCSRHMGAEPLHT